MEIQLYKRKKKREKTKKKDDHTIKFEKVVSQCFKTKKRMKMNTEFVVLRFFIHYNFN